MVGVPHHSILWSSYEFGAWRHKVSVTVKNCSPRCLERAVFRPRFSSLCLNVSRRISSIKSKSFSNCLVKGSVASLTCRASFSNVMRTLELAAALPTSSTS